jgi:alpha-glucosidase
MIAAAHLDDAHHDGSDLYVDRSGDEAELRVRVPEGAAQAVTLRYVKDGEPRTVEAAQVSRSGETWWRAELPLRNAIIPYRWLLTGGTLGYRWLNGTGTYAHEVPPGNDFILLAEPRGPDWHLSSVGYEVFLDRFAASGEAHELPGWAVAREWHEAPSTTRPLANTEIFGGDLLGLERGLDHVAELGANAIWLTPFFPSESNHRYDPTAYDRVDPLLGGDDAFDALASAARARGVRLIGDISPDHCGSGHEWFRRARADAGTAERSFFLFDRLETHGYAAWLGTENLPRFDWRSDELRARMAAALQTWLDRGLDGWRIGSATTIGRHRDLDLNTEIARWTREQTGEGLVVADYWNDFQPDVDGLGWHGVINYAGFLRPVWWWLCADDGHAAFDVFTATPAPVYGGVDTARVMQSFRAGLPWEVVLHSWLPLDTHDTPRFRTVCGSRERQLVGAGLQMTMPGVPMIFAGDELGLAGSSGLDARRTIPWNEREHWDIGLLREYRALIELRRGSDALARGGLRLAHACRDAIAYLRETKIERILCLASRAPHEPIRVPFESLTTLYGDDARDGVLPSDGPAFHVWRVD